MKRVVTLAAFLIAIIAHAEYYLYWEFDQTAATGETVEFSLAKVRVQGNEIRPSDEAVYLTLGDNGNITGFPQTGFPDPINGTMIAPVYANLGTYATSGYSFAVELYLVDATTGNLGDWVKTSDYVSFTELKNFGNVYENMSIGGDKPYNFAVRPTPEPTSGLLVLLGIGALALRRRKVEA